MAHVDDRRKTLANVREPLRQFSSSVSLKGLIMGNWLIGVQADRIPIKALNPVEAKMSSDVALA
jgi:hypothetical protein